MNIFYNAGIRLYGVAARVASHWSAKVRNMLKGQSETLLRLESFRSTMAPDGFDVWFHVASLGEFEQARPLIEQLLQARPEIKILLSFFSPSGYEVRVDYNPRVAVVYLPFDTPKRVREFLDAAQPKMAVFVKYEFWGNYLEELYRRSIPTYIICAVFRPGQIFFRPWGGMFRKMLRKFERLYVQDERSRQLLSGIGVENVSIAGDTRFDRVTAIKDTCKALPEIEAFVSAVPQAQMLVVGSSWGKDEDVYIPWLHTRKHVRAIIAPHEFSKERLANLRHNLGGNMTMLLSDFRALYEKDPNEAIETASKLQYLIVDCFGLLSSLYRFADVAYVGGGFGAGIHNINEAAVYGIPVVFGPKFKKFNEARALIRCRGAFRVDGSRSLRKVFDTLFDRADERQSAGRAAGEYISKNVGATPKIMSDIFGIDISEK